MLVQENRWRAQRYGIDEGMIDFGIGQIVPFPDLVEEAMELLSPAARELRCLDELLGARAIIESGTSSHRQLATYERAVAAGAEPLEAMRDVVDFLIEETVTF